MQETCLRAKRLLDATRFITSWLEQTRKIISAITGLTRNNLYVSSTMVHLRLFYPLTAIVWCRSQICNFSPVCIGSAWERSNAAVTGALFECLFIFSIVYVYHPTPTLRCVASKHFVSLRPLSKPCGMDHVSEPNELKKSSSAQTQVTRAYHHVGL